jgi:hypothetical protein
MQTKICPRKIITSTCVVSDIERLFNCKGNQITVHERSLTTLKGKGYVLFDFGLEICGGVRLLSNLTSDCKVKLTFGESVAEAMAENGYKNATSAHSVRVFETVLPSYSDVRLGDTGFRFVKLELLEDKEVKLKSLYAENQIFNKKTIWEYRGEDKRLKEIFTTAKRTVDLCASGKYVWDGIKRDRLVWAGDLYSEMIALTTVYGRLKKVEDTINFSRKNTPLPAWMNNIPSYSAWWVVTLVDYYNLTGYKPIVEQNLAYLEKLASFVDENISSEGELTFEDKFIDLSLMYLPCGEDAVRALYLVAANKAKCLLGKESSAYSVWDKIIIKLNKKPINCCGQKSIAALKFWATGELSGDEKYILVDKTTSQSTFMSYFVFNAIYKIFGKEKAIEEIKSYFGAMLDLGATTFWENFEPAWAENSIRLDELPTETKSDFHGDYGKVCYKGFRMSLCHGWSSGVIKLIKDMAD